MELSFEGDINRNWHEYPLEALFQTPIRKSVSSQFMPLSDNLRNEARRADVLCIWTDCDREGKALGADVADHCKLYNCSIEVWRAHFSSMLPNDIHRAAQNHVLLDMKQAEAVRTRSELDLRIGAAFTRLQTIKLRSFFTGIEGSKVISYGSCQFPTLGFVVDRHMQIQYFIPQSACADDRSFSDRS